MVVIRHPHSRQQFVLDAVLLVHYGFLHLFALLLPGAYMAIEIQRSAPPRYDQIDLRYFYQSDR